MILLMTLKIHLKENYLTSLLISIFKNIRNPGNDVYAGCKIDYRGEDVNVDIFIKVLLGNFTALKGVGII